MDRSSAVVYGPKGFGKTTYSGEISKKLGLKYIVEAEGWDGPIQPFDTLYIYENVPKDNKLRCYHINEFKRHTSQLYLGKEFFQSLRKGSEMEEHAKYQPKPVTAEPLKLWEEDSVSVEKVFSLHVPDLTDFPAKLTVSNGDGTKFDYLKAEKPKPPFEIIGITGKKRSGKDTLADEFVKLGYKKLSFAEPMKKMLETFLGHIDDDKKEEILPKFGVSYRHMAQTLGTDWGRNLIGQNIWVHLLKRKLVLGRSYVISDVRFDNEANFIRELGGQLIHVLRDTGGLVDAHSSESGISWVLGDQSLRNQYAYSVYKENCVYLAKKIVEGRSRT